MTVRAASSRGMLASPQTVSQILVQLHFSDYRLFASYLSLRLALLQAKLSSVSQLPIYRNAFQHRVRIELTKEVYSVADISSDLPILFPYPRIYPGQILIEAWGDDPG